MKNMFNQYCKVLKIVPILICFELQVRFFDKLLNFFNIYRDPI